MTGNVSESNFSSNGVVLKNKKIKNYPRCNCWFFPVTFLFFSLTNCTNKMTSGRYQCLMTFKFWTLELYAGWRVCDETAQANMEQQWNHWLTLVILYFIVVGNKKTFFFSFCLSLSHYCPSWTVSPENTKHSSVEYQWFALIQSKSSIVPPGLDRPLVISNVDSVSAHCIWNSVSMN